MRRVCPPRRGGRTCLQCSNQPRHVLGAEFISISDLRSRRLRLLYDVRCYTSRQIPRRRLTKIHMARDFCMRLLAMLSKVDYGGGLWEHTGGPTSMAHCVLALHILFSNGKRSWQARRGEP